MYFRQTLITFSRMGSSAKVFTIIVNIYLNSTVYVLLYCLMSEAVNRTSRNYNLPGKGTSPCWKSLPELKHSKSTHEIGTLVCKDHNRRTVWPPVGSFNCEISRSPLDSSGYVLPTLEKHGMFSLNIVKNTNLLSYYNAYSCICKIIPKI